MGVYGFEDSKDKTYLSDIFKVTNHTQNITYPTAGGDNFTSRYNFQFGEHEGYKPIMVIAESKVGGEANCNLYVTGATVGYATSDIPNYPLYVSIAIFYRKDATESGGTVGIKYKVIWVREDILGTF